MYKHCRSGAEPRLGGGDGGARPGEPWEVLAPGFSFPLPLPLKKRLGLLGFLVAGEEAPHGQMWMGVTSG